MSENLAGIVRENVVALQRRLQINSNDDDALDKIFNLSLDLRYGRNGYPQNDSLEREALEIASRYGHARACYERARVEISNPEQALYYIKLGLSRNPKDQQLKGLERALGGIQRRQESDKKQ